MTEKYLWLAGKIKKGEIVMEGQRKTRLLLADDSVTIRKVVEMTLPLDRFHITSVGDGEAALEALGNERPDVLLADVIMPKMDGYELCSVVRSSPEFQDIPVILLVGTFENYDEVRGREAGADDYIVKPFETNDLIEKIREVTARRKVETEATAEAPVAAVAETVAVSPLDAASTEAPESEEVSLEYSDRVEFDSLKEPVDLVESSAPEEEVASFETLSDVPTHHEYCVEDESAAICEAEAVAVTAEDSLTAGPEETPVETLEEAVPGEENFPWEEEIDLPESEPVAATIEEPSPEPPMEQAAEELPASAEEHVFSLADFRPDVVEALAKEHEMPEVSPEGSTECEMASPEAEETPATREPVPVEETVEVEEVTQAEMVMPAEETVQEEEIQPEEAVEAEAVLPHEEVAQVEEAVPAEETVPAVEPVETVETASAVEPVETVLSPPAAIPADSLQALQESVERSVHRAVLNAFGDIFREAVEKAAREVVPALVEKAIREELERQRG